MIDGVKVRELGKSLIKQQLADFVMKDRSGDLLSVGDGKAYM